MQDERDPGLLRHFAASARPLADAQFVARVAERLHVYSGRRLLAAALRGAGFGVRAGVSFGIVAPLKLRHAGLVALAATGVAIWTLVRSLL
jgi:hypothetical protein